MAARIPTRLGGACEALTGFAWVGAGASGRVDACCAEVGVGAGVACVVSGETASCWADAAAAGAGSAIVNQKTGLAADCNCDWANERNGKKIKGFSVKRMPK